MKRIAEGDEKAFASLYAGFYDKIYSVALMYLKAHQMAEDVTQQVFLKLWERRTSLESIQKVDAFLFITARNEIMNIFRRQSVQASYQAFIRELFSQEAATPEDLLIIKQKGRLMESIISKLPVRQQEAFRLSRFRGLSYEQIATEMNISLPTVKEHMSKALQHIRELLLTHKDELLLLFFLCSVSP